MCDVVNECTCGSTSTSVTHNDRGGVGVGYPGLDSMVDTGAWMPVSDDVRACVCFLRPVRHLHLRVTALMIVNMVRGCLG